MSFDFHTTKNWTAPVQKMDCYLPFGRWSTCKTPIAVQKMDRYGLFSRISSPISGHPYRYTTPYRHSEGIHMGIRRINTWRGQTDRSGYDYSRVPDADLLAMKEIARPEAAVFLYDTRGGFIQALDCTGLAAINRELWARQLTPAQLARAMA